MLRSWLGWMCGVVALAGCGGNVFVDGGSSGAGAGTVTGSGAGTVTGSASGSGGAPGVTTSQASTSTLVAASTGTSGVPACEDLGYVAVGGDCPVEGVTCTMHVCCGGVVVCKGGRWIATAPPCAGPCRTCGEVACEADAICVRDDVHDVEQWSRCALDPCAPAALDCTCAAAICTSVNLGCIGATAGELTCTDFTE